MVLLFSCFLVGSVMLTSDNSFQEYTESKRTSDMIQADGYVLHSPIVIESDADFTLQSWPGAGTELDPFIIEGLNITDKNGALFISNTVAHFVIRDCILSSMEVGMDRPTNYGAVFTSVENGTVQSSVVTLLYHSSCSRITIQDSVFTRGIQYQNSENCMINSSEVNYGVQIGGTNQNIMIIGNNITGGAWIDNSYNCTIIGNTIFNCSTGLAIRYSEEITIIDNIIFNYYQDGINVYYSVNCEIRNNTLSDNGHGELNDRSRSDKSVMFAQATNCSLVNNSIGKAGFTVDGYFGHFKHEVVNNTIEGKELGYFWNVSKSFVDASEYGQMILVQCNEIKIANGYFDRVHSPIQVHYSPDNIIINCTTLSSQFALFTNSASNTTVVNCSFGSALYGALLASSSYSKVFNSTFIGCEQGMALIFSTGTSVLNCTFTDNKYGLELVSHSYGIFANNSFINCGLFLDRFDGLSSCQHTMENNTVNGKELGYYWDEQNLLIDGTLLGQIIMANCVNVTIENGTLWNSSIAAQVAYSKNCTLRNLDIGDVQEGIELADTQNCTVDLCNFTHIGFRGIVGKGVGDTISNNILSGVAVDWSFSSSGGPAISIEGENIYYNPGSYTIINNTVSNSYLGIHMDSEDCSAINNTVYDCEIGIGATEPGTKILNNTLRDNFNTLSIRDGCIIHGNYFKNASQFFDWSGGDNTSFCYNMLVNCSWGFPVPGLNCTIVNNTFINTELQLSGSIDAYRHTIEGNTVNGKPLAYIWNATSEVFNLDNYGQLILVNGTDLRVSAETSINSYAGVHLAHSKDCVVEDVNFSDCFGTQVYVSSSDSIMIRNVTITDSYRSISIYNAVNITVYNNTLMNNMASIRSLYTPGTMIRDNLVEDCEWGIIVRGCDNASIINNTITRGSNYGIDIDSSYGVEILQNAIRENEAAGINIRSDCDNFAIIENAIVNNTLDGISLPNSDWWHSPTFVNNGTITNNAIYDNGGYGINLQEFATNITVYNNGIGWNEKGNARDNDTTRSNVWDDGVSQGNWWSDYSGQGNYSIPSESVDRFPRRVLSLDSPDDIVFDEDSIGHSIEWITEGPHQNHFEIYINGTFSEANDWTVSPIVVPVDGLNQGVYNYTILLFDSYGHCINDSVIVTVTQSIVTTSTTTTTSTTSTTTTTTSFDPIIFIIIGLSTVVVLIVIVLIIKTNK